VAGRGHLLDPLLVPIAVLATNALLAGRRLVGVARDRRQLRALFSQYVPAAVARELVDSGHAQSAAAGARLNVTVLFCDLRGFTAVAARLIPAQVRELLDCYYEALSPLILERGGTVMQYTGDEIFAVFGAPTPIPDSASTALDVAHDMFAHLGALNEHLVSEGLPPVNYGIGLHTGEVVAAHVGSQIRRQYSVIGDTVNVGSRFCSLARDGQIAYSEQLRAACSTPPPGKAIGGIQLKGVEHPVTAYLIQAGPREEDTAPPPPSPDEHDTTVVV
jgi:adenylate cyclase